MENLFFELDFNSNNAEQKIAILKAEIDRLSASFKTANTNSLKLQESQNKLNQLSEKYPEVANLIVDSVSQITSEITDLQAKQAKLNLTIDSEVQKFFELDKQIKSAENSLKLFGNSTNTTETKAKKLKETISELEKQLTEVNTDTEEGQDKFLRLSEQIDQATKSYRSFTDRTTIAQNAVKRLTNEINELEKAQKRAGANTQQGRVIGTQIENKRNLLQTAQNAITPQNSSQNANIPNLPNGLTSQIQQLIGNNSSGLNGLNTSSLLSSRGIGTFVSGLSRLTIIGGVITAVAALTDKMIDFVLTTAQGAKEFETLRTTLNTSLGNMYRTSEAMERIKKFAAETPYEVSQLTKVFSMLAGVNLKPTNDQLKAMGDFASSKNIPIEQLTEAIIDVSDVERWRNLGVQISNSGAKMTATFNGQTIVVDKTVKGAMKMVEIFGNVAGVQNAMIAQSQTLAGKESNLADSQAQLADTWGQLFLPTAKKILDIKKSLYDVTNDLVKATNELIFAEDKNFQLAKQISNENIQVEKTRLSILREQIKEKEKEAGFNAKTGKFSKQDAFTIDTETGKAVSLRQYIVTLREREAIIANDIADKEKEHNTYLSNRKLMMQTLGQMQLAGYQLTQKELDLIANYVERMPSGAGKEFQEFFLKTRENIVELQQSIVGILPEGLRRLRAELPAELESITNQFNAKRNEMINQAMQAGLISPDDMLRGVISPTANDPKTMLAVNALKEQLAVIDKIEANRKQEQMIKNKLERERIVREYQYYLKELNANSIQAEIDLKKALGTLTTDRILQEQLVLDLKKMQVEKEKELFEAGQKAKEMGTDKEYLQGQIDRLSKNPKANKEQLEVLNKQLAQTLENENKIKEKYANKEKETTQKTAIEIQNYRNDLSAKDRDYRIAILEDRITAEQEILDMENLSLENRIDKLQLIRDLEIKILKERQAQIREEMKTITDSGQKKAKELEIKKIDLEIAKKNKGNISTGIGTTTNLSDRISSINTEVGMLNRDTDIQSQEAQLALQAKLKDGWRFNDLRAEKAYQNKLYEIRQESLKKEIALLEQKVATNEQLYGKGSKQEEDATKELNAKKIELNQSEIDQATQRRKDWNDTLQQSYDIGKQAAKDYFQYVIQGYDNDIRRQENRVDRAARIAERGNAELLEREQTRLDKLKEERENYVKAQQVLDLIEFGSKSTVAIANAAAAPFPLNLVAIPLTIATLIAGIAQVNSLKGSVSSFAEGTDSVTEPSGNNAPLILDMFKPKDKRDKVLSLLSPREAVIQEDIAVKNPNVVKALRRGLLTDRDLQYLHSPNFSHQIAMFSNYSQMSETNAILRELRFDLSRLQSEVNVVTQQINITREGIYYANKAEQSRVSKINKLR